MLHYKFPVINHIDDILKAIEGDKSFIVADRGDHTIINYVITGPETFPSMKVNGGSAKMREEHMRINALRRECRGIVFDKITGKIIRRPLHKFFNLNEREETQFNKVDLNQPHVILEKLDGSSISVFKLQDGLHFGTRMGITNVALQVEKWVKINTHYINFCNQIIEKGYTPIFEWCSRQQRIVIDHPLDKLELVAIRHMITGQYLQLPCKLK